MPISVSVSDDLQRLVATLDDIRLRQIPFAASRALNDTGQAARAAVTSAMPEIFDRPTPFTASSIAMLASRKDNLVTTVLVKDQQAKYLLLEETGGERSPAGNSRIASRALVAPGKAAALNQYGNLPNSYLAGLRRRAEADIAKREVARQRVVERYRKRRLAARHPGRKAASDKGVVYFKGKGPDGRGPGGYFIRGPGHTFRRLTGFEGTERYKPRFGFRRRVEEVARATFAAALSRRLAEASRPS